MHPTLMRLDDLARHLSTDLRVRAVLGLGSAGAQVDRFDDHSDIDFFVIVDDDATKNHYIVETDWLAGFGGRAVYSFRNDRNGRKALLDDGLFLEYAVFTPSELERIPFAGARVVWCRAPFSLAPDQYGAVSGDLDTVEFHLNEALTNLYVGLQRELRGERLTAMRFIQVLAVDRLLSLLRLTAPTRLRQPDPFERTRRIEFAALDDPVPLDQMCRGYSYNLEAAAAVLDWLTARHDADPAIVNAITALLHRAAATSRGAR